MRPFAKISDWFTDFVVRLLVKERRTYHQRFPNDVARLRETLRPGDVVLVDGSQRISEVIKYLTQSSWSHAAVYVGDSLIRRGDHQASIWTQRYGTAADALLVEANVEDGVTASPLSKYVNHNLRICRPINLRPGDLSTVLDTVISQIGSPYNRDHIQSLLWYFLPVEIMPKRWQRRALELYRNAIVHYLVAPSFLARRLLAGPSSDTDLRQDLASWLDLFYGEFYAPRGEVMAAHFDALLDHFARFGWVERSEGHLRVTEKGTPSFRRLAEQTRGVVEVYYATFAAALGLQGSMSAKALQKAAEEQYERSEMLGEVDRREAANAITFANAVDVLVRLGALELAPNAEGASRARDLSYVPGVAFDDLAALRERLATALAAR